MRYTDPEEAKRKLWDKVGKIIERLKPKKDGRLVTNQDIVMMLVQAKVEHPSDWIDSERDDMRKEMLAERMTRLDEVEMRAINFKYFTDPNTILSDTEVAIRLGFGTVKTWRLLRRAYGRMSE